MPSDAPAASEGRSFRALFDRWSRRVRARLALRHVLTGAAIGLVIGAGASAAAWRTRSGNLRPAGAAGGLLGAAVGLAVARRKRWADGDVALFLDGKLRSDEAISTAVEIEGKESGGASDVIVSHAAK